MHPWGSCADSHNGIIIIVSLSSSLTQSITIGGIDEASLAFKTIHTVELVGDDDDEVYLVSMSPDATQFVIANESGVFV